MIYACCDENRKAAVLGNPTLNGIDYLEVLDNDAPAGVRGSRRCSSIASRRRPRTWRRPMS